MGLIPISDIKKIFEATSNEEIMNITEYYSSDSRSGVQKLVDSYLKKYNNYLSEIERIHNISKFENECYELGYEFIAGIDEVGRGPLAGPVMTAAVILEKECDILYINDSKKLSASKREELFNVITEKAVAYSIGTVSPVVIDEINILQATYVAMKDAINGLSKTPDFILVDAVTIPDIKIKQKGIIQGDAKSISIGAASIVAKVTRDNMMIEFDKIYPEYGFAKNKGYGSAEHIEAIKKYGLCPIHRRSFVKNFV